MKKKRTIMLLSALAIVILLGMIFSGGREEIVVAGVIEYGDRGEIIKVLDQEGETVVEYSIEELRDWARENWDNIFEERPAFGEIREADPDHFYRFDDGASLSPKYNYLAFSVSDYAAATHLSFTGIIDVRTGELRLVGKESTGSIREIIWSSEETHIAYVLDSARAQGDYLSVDSVGKMEKEFILSGEDLLARLDSEEGGFMPGFRDIKWIGERLEFTTDGIEEESVRWSIGFRGNDLRGVER